MLITNINIADNIAIILRILFKIMKREQTGELQSLINFKGSFLFFRQGQEIFFFSKEVQRGSGAHRSPI